jgi:hypothetical protein
VEPRPMDVVGVAYRRRRWQMSNRFDFQTTIKKKLLLKKKKKQEKENIRKGNGESKKSWSFLLFRALTRKEAASRLEVKISQEGGEEGEIFSLTLREKSIKIICLEIRK